MRPATHRLIQPSLLVAVFFLDRWTKFLAQTKLEPIGNIPLLPFFHLTYIENTGAAWGILQGNNRILVAVSILLIGALFYLRRSWPKSNLWAHYGMILVVGGALGNLYDRIVLHAVVDFLDFRVWPVFNLADSCITVGACALAWGMHLADRAAQAGKKPA